MRLSPRALAVALAFACLGGSLDSVAAEGDDKAKSDQVRRDPAGLKGISPYMEAIAKGRERFVKGEKDAALEAFQEAIDLKPERALAYLLLAQVRMSEGDLDNALEVIEKGDPIKDEPGLQGKVDFVRAEVKERRANSKPGKDNAPGSPLEALGAKWDEVKQTWQVYLEYINANDAEPEYSDSASERQKQIDARVKRDKDFQKVRERIAADEKAATKK